MNDVINVEGVSKKYLIWHENREDIGLAGTLVRGAKSFFQTISHSLRHGMGVTGGSVKEEFWALKDINLTIKQGERVGVIGRNGAGKSTLMKIMSRVTFPTTGKITIRGRVASLLEIGTGFHKELTGRENIFLNGVILGMNRHEIKRKMDDIIDFSGIEKFLDTPVKRYSSGMYVRLAFAVAANLEPEIMLVDEVLAVGDFDFQEKCLSRMTTFSQEGRTVVFISHNMEAVGRLVNRCYMLNEGSIADEGNPSDVINRYLQRHRPSRGQLTFPLKQTAPAQVLSIELLKHELSDSTFYENEDLCARIDFEIRNADACKARLILFITRPDGTVAWYSDTSKSPEFSNAWEIGVHSVTVRFPKNVLRAGSYGMIPALSWRRKSWYNHPLVTHPWHEGAIEFDIHIKSEGSVMPLGRNEIFDQGVISVPPIMYKS